MKFLHIGDLHIGRTLGEFDLLEDQRYILDQILGIAVEKAVDAILIAGDVYDKPVPSERAVALLDDFLRKAVSEGIRVFLISGNHDSEERLNFGSSFFEEKGLHIKTICDGTLYHRELEDSFGKVHIYLLPFVKASQVKHFFPEEKIDTYDDAVRTLIRHAEIDEKERNILVAHQFVIASVPSDKRVSGSIKGKKAKDKDFGIHTQPEDEEGWSRLGVQLAGSESAAVQSVGLVEQIGADCFDAFDYVALGHIHSGQRVGRDEVRYCGSPLKYSVSEAGNDKSIPFVTLSEKGDISIELIPLKPMRDLRHIRGKLEKLLEKGNVTDEGDYIYVTLTDEEPFTDAMGIIRQYYPNTVKLDFDNAYMRELQKLEPLQSLEKKSFTELISDFYEKIYGVEIGEEELMLIRDVAKEAGIQVEAPLSVEKSAAT